MATFRKRGPYQWEARIRKRGYPTTCNTFATKADATPLVIRAPLSPMLTGSFCQAALPLVFQGPAVVLHSPSEWRQR